MKSKIFLLLLLFSLSCGNHKQEVPTDENAQVMICTGHHSHRFHSHICKGLESCRGEIEYVTLGEAEDMGKTPCGYCYKKHKPLSKSDPHYYDDWDN